MYDLRQITHLILTFLIGAVMLLNATGIDGIYDSGSVTNVKVSVVVAIIPIHALRLIQCIAGV